MKMHKQQKGEYAYPPYERKRVIIRTAAYFLIFPCSIFAGILFHRQEGKSPYNRRCFRTAAIEQKSGIRHHVLQDSKVQRNRLSGNGLRQRRAPVPVPRANLDGSTPS